MGGTEVRERTARRLGRFFATRFSFEFLTPLSAMQLVCLAAFGLVLLLSILLLHHQTTDYFTPVTVYLSSIKIAIPPAAIFLFTYLFAFVSGNSLTDAPKAALSFARNTFFQSFALMGTALCASLAFAAYGYWVLFFTTPPAYKDLVDKLLGGSSDNLTIVQKEIANIQASNPDLAARLGRVVEVFQERYDVNAGKRTLSGDRARILVRTLESDATGEWGLSPLRIFASAEAYSMFGQAVEHANGIIASTNAQSPQTLFQKAVDLYSQIGSSSSALVTPGMKTSALLNTGNTYYYMKDYAKALTAWQQANSEQSVGRNLSAWSNVVAALVLLGRLQEAVTEGEAGKTWAEKNGVALTQTYPYAGLVQNMAYAKIELGDAPGALSDMATANALQDDDLTRQNLALALILVKRESDAQTILREMAPPAEANAPPSPAVARCVYFIWGLSMPTAPVAERAANFAAFLNEQHSAADYTKMSEKDFAALLSKVAAAMPNADMPCGSLSAIKPVMALLSTTPP